MIRRAAMLGRSPITRRVIAAAVLVSGALASSYYRSGYEWQWINVATHLLIAGAALLLLHLRWQNREHRAVTPEKAKDVFS